MIACGSLRLRCLLFVLTLSAAMDGRAADAQQLIWNSLRPIPDTLGFAGSFAGVSVGSLLVAGGANFPDGAPWEGGAKRWHDRVFVLESPRGVWQAAGKLPRPLGYGVSITTPDGLACLGGSDAERHYADCFLLRWTDRNLQVEPLPALPQPCANACGAIVGRTIYVAGGLGTPQDTQAFGSFWALDLDHLSAGWTQFPTWPGSERMLAVAASHDGAFYLFSGAALIAGEKGQTTRRWLRDAYRFTPASGWRRIADLPRVAVAAPSPAPVIYQELLVLGGDDGTQALASPTKHTGFRREVLAYDTRLDRWRSAGTLPFALVTTPVVRWSDQIVIAGGESRPAVRSTAVWSAKIITSPARRD